MTYADELRALADWLEVEVEALYASGMYEQADKYATKSNDLYTIAAKMEGKVAVAAWCRPTPHCHPGMYGKWKATLQCGCTDLDREEGYGATEAEALANLQAVLDGGEG